MLKYNNANTTGETEVIDAYLDPMEYVYWKGRGNKAAYIFNNSKFIAPFALIWLFIDGTMLFSMLPIGKLMESSEGRQMLGFIIPFFIVHLLPVWIWIGSMFKGAKKWEKSAYAITDKQILVKNLATGMNVQCYKYDKIRMVKLNRSFMDNLLGTSDLQFYLIDGRHIDILDIKASEAERVFPQVKQRIEETPCSSEIHTETTAGQSGGHECKDYFSDFNPYS